jgi:hypothetical protein
MVKSRPLRIFELEELTDGEKFTPPKTELKPRLPSIGHPQVSRSSRFVVSIASHKLHLVNSVS